MIIFPAIDLKDGQCVRLVQGRAEDKTVYSDNPARVAIDFEEQGAQWLHVVDLDGAFSGKPRNTEVIKQIAAGIKIPFQVGGGLRRLEDVETILNAGARRVIIGSKAVSSPEFIKNLINNFGSEHIILGLDARDGMVAIEGWVETSSLSAIDFGQQMKSLGVKTAVFTDVSRDGLLQGPNLASIENMARNTGLQIIASGGVTSQEDVRNLKAMEGLGVCGAIIGKAIYDGRITLVQALQVTGDGSSVT
ncbi:MAG: 1-(5-phosphoribosyl)-5-[(5-phosphoribosylamino)methylideneamino]imidazole-4-carboxamide isomerase [Syntrophomonadaceae bacterium]|nr:1-(5-phosphoribosyl)-5-[(5-phosphoribosylamino)methylideneamino]imidazole-4-carboxamide isomerase [Syntrophomonadaceae bacterium]